MTVSVCTSGSAIARNLRASSGRLVVVIIPACQEAAVIAQTLASIHAQTRQPTMTIVAANNCTDGTEEVAARHGAVVFDANPNAHKKAGALNAVLECVMPALSAEDYVLIADADTTLSPEFIERASSALDEDPKVGGVGGAFLGRDSHTALGTLQQMEYYRYLNQIHRNGNRAFVLSGTGSLFRVSALNDVYNERRYKRNGQIPSGGSFYCTRSLTEDNEITLALLTLGWKCISPEGIRTTTDVMETPSMLWKQRERWYLGALWNLHDYGRKMPWYMRWVYWVQQCGLLLATGVLVLNTAIIAFFVTSGTMAVNGRTALCIGLATLVWLTQVSGVWKMGWKPRLLALTGIEQLYAMGLTVVFACTVGKFLRGHRGGWTLT